MLVQPEVKNFVKDTPAKAPAASKAAPAKKAEAKREEAGSPGAGFEAFRPAVLPLSLLAIAGAGAAAVKADPEFAKLLDESWGAKNSITTGAGYETAPGLKVGTGGRRDTSCMGQQRRQGRLGEDRTASALGQGCMWGGALCKRMLFGQRTAACNMAPEQLLSLGAPPTPPQDTPFFGGSNTSGPKAAVSH